MAVALIKLFRKRRSPDRVCVATPWVCASRTMPETVPQNMVLARWPVMMATTMDAAPALTYTPAGASA